VQLNSIPATACGNRVLKEVLPRFKPNASKAGSGGCRLSGNSSGRGYMLHICYGKPVACTTFMGGDCKLSIAAWPGKFKRHSQRVGYMLNKLDFLPLHYG